MTKPKRWPRLALWARSDAIAAAREIDRLGEEAKRAIQDGNWYRARLAIAELQRLASKEIVVKLLAVEEAVSCEECPYYERLGEDEG